jgi:hypothetical protein
VVYYFDASYDPSVVARYSPETGYAVSFPQPGPFVLRVSVTFDEPIPRHGTTRVDLDVDLPAG